ncbi:PAS domain-containing hybrid sensor histidine kinase/response regulator [Chamaesiphon polymorphus]|uniref:histidine kinase n=1 Tax=Chamaesiphon polymorphus CCALA 037 TaxID=2107692 RepID=A0A2T1GAR6_9CYAN|nr:PAS domain S-box protein [Chamaesiphon polymorphus]PSB54347.1 hybrid sensor histidine kinase/response regulator [Chamaesiphon polymorphus CCALA 037]
MQSKLTPDNCNNLDVLALALQFQNEEFQKICALAPCGHHALDLHSIYLHINQSELNMLGYERDEVVGKICFLDLLTPKSNRKLRDNCVKFQERGFIQDVELEMVRKDGSVCPVSLSATIVRDEEGNYLISRSVVVDISERQRDAAGREEIALMRQNNRDLTEQILDAIPDRISIYSLDERRVIYTNYSIGELLGYPRSEIERMGDRIVEILHHPDEPNPVDAIVGLQDGEIKEFEYRMRHFNGEWRWHYLRCKNFAYRPDGSVCQVLTIVRDISQRKLSEQIMHEQASLLDIVPDAMFVNDLNYQILFWNQGSERLYDLQTADAIGRDVRQFDTPDSLAQLAEVMEIVLTTGKWEGELTKVTATGQPLSIISRRALVRDAAGNANSILNVDTDITEKKQLESQLLASQRLESLGTLASGIAHDLNNIFTPILGIAEVLPLQFPNLDGRTQNLLKILSDSTHRGVDLVKQILSFTPGVEGKTAVIQVRDVIAEIQRIVRQTFPKNIETIFNYADSLATIEADSTQIHQVLMNLCVNARDAMPSGGILTVSTENLKISQSERYANDENSTKIHLDARPGDYIAISIADTGTGIAPELIDRIFEPFFTTKDIGKGTGLGLSTSIGIIKSHGGFIKVNSEVGIGTCFKIYLPATDSYEIQSPPMPSFESGSNQLVLIVDDETSIRSITGNTLETYNYRILTAGDGIEAIATYAERKNDIDVILLDLMMPSLDILTTVRTIHKLNPHVRIIAMSGLVANEQITQTLQECGVMAFLQKPFTVEHLLRTLSQVCSQ